MKYFSDVKSAVGEVHDNLREVMTYFRTRMDPLGLLHALQGMAKTFSDRNGVALEIRNSAQNLNLTDEQEVQVFHIVQEALGKYREALDGKACRCGNRKVAPAA
jgi:two-component system nitrate/nitrite sensor histidine kinase NarX